MGDFASTLKGLRKITDVKATENREERDVWNDKTRTHLTTRNGFNGQVRDLISEVQRQKVIRDAENGKVRDAKRIRSDCNDKVRDSKAKIRLHQDDGGGDYSKESPRERRERQKKTPAAMKRKLEELERDFERKARSPENEKKVMAEMKRIKRALDEMAAKEDSNMELKAARAELQAAIDEQEAAHQVVTVAAELAQQSHDLMIELSAEVDRLREKADNAQSEVRKSKKSADRAHQNYIVSLRCLHSIQDIIRAKSNREKGIGDRGAKSQPRVEVQDLMGKLMSGETLSTDELMALQRGE